MITRESANDLVSTGKMMDAFDKFYDDVSMKENEAPVFITGGVRARQMGASGKCSVTRKENNCYAGTP